MHRRHGANFWDIHRADLQLALFHHAELLGAKFRFGVLVENHDFSIPQVTLSDGEQLQGDLIVAADGRTKSLRLETIS